VVTVMFCYKEHSLNWLQIFMLILANLDLKQVFRAVQLNMLYKQFQCVY